MGWVKDNFFGGNAKKAAQQQIAAGDRAMATQKEYYEQARGDIMKLFPQSYQMLQTSYQQAIDQVGAGKASAADILRQAFNQSNQIQQSGSNAAISALLGRPQQMQLPQSAPQPMGMMQPRSQMMQTGLRSGIPNTDTRASVIEMSPEQRLYGTSQPQMQQGMYGVGLAQPQSQFGVTDMRAGMPGSVLEMEQVQRPFGGVGTSNPNQPQMQTTQDAISPAVSLNAPLAQQTSLGATPQVQNNVDTSGIGLSGAESALNAGMQGQLNALQGGSQQAQGTLQQTLGSQLGALRQGFGGAEEALNAYGGQALGAANQGFGQGRADILGGASNALGMLGAAQTQGLNRIDQSTGQAINYLNPYSSTGSAAQQREAALSGALGGQAQQQALSEFSESPGQKFLRERQEQALLRNASATGGLRGGSTLSALQEQASGIAAQQQQQQLENMRSIAQRGQQAATNQGQFAQSGGQAGANLIGSLAQTGAGIAANAGQAAGGMAASGGQFGANILNQLGQNVSGLRQNLGGSEANAFGNAGSGIANMQNQLGGNMANVFGNTAGGLAGLRSQAGQQVAGQLNQQTSGLSNNQLALGQMLAGLDTGTASQLANLLTQGGTAGAQNQMNLATLLANLATGQGSNLSQIQIGQGNAQAAGTVGGAAGKREGVGAVTGFISDFLNSDERLKDNITKLADGPVGLFAWTWKHIKEIPESLRGAWSIGVIAQEVQDKFPECVVERDGFLAVNYAQLAREVANV